MVFLYMVSCMHSFHHSLFRANILLPPTGLYVLSGECSIDILSETLFSSLLHSFATPLGCICSLLDLCQWFVAFSPRFRFPPNAAGAYVSLLHVVCMFNRHFFYPRLRLLTLLRFSTSLLSAAFRFCVVYMGLCNRCPDIWFRSAWLSYCS